MDGSLTKGVTHVTTSMMSRDGHIVSAAIKRSAMSVRSVAAAMPARNDMQQELVDAAAAQARGYFLPDEDERLRDVFVRYLSLRATLLEVVGSIQGLIDQLDEAGEREETWDDRLRAFIIGFLAAAMLMRAASFLVDLAAGRSVVRKKLDEAEPRFGIPAKSFTAVYKNLGSYRSMWRFLSALRFYELHAEDIAGLARDDHMKGLIELLDQESKYFQDSKQAYLRRKLHYRLHSFKRRHVSGYKKVMFQLLKLSGRVVSEMRQPFVKAHGQGKRVTAGVLATIKPLLRAGDVLITRHDDAMSNLFLPGYWPHAALYIGDTQERRELGVELAGVGALRTEGCHFLEAKKDGVLLRRIEETLNVDAFMVLRPKLEPQQRAQALSRGLTHEGKLYDFMFDFRVADRLACTEVIYRTYHGIGELDRVVSFELKRHSGRPCISAEDLIEQALGSGHFEKVVEFGVEEDTVRIF
jgi:hypothetical protein